MIFFTKTEARKNFATIFNTVKFQKKVVAVGSKKEDAIYLIPQPELDGDIPVSAMNAQSVSFDFLDQEPDIYSVDDLKKRYV